MTARTAMRASNQPRRHKLSVADYERMIEAGVFAPDDRVELIEGDLIEMAPIGPPHAGVTNRLNRLLVQRAGNSAVVAVGNPLKLPPRSMPQPDFQLLRPRGDDYGTAHPESGDVLLAIEVSDTTLRFDRIRKARVYAGAGVHEYWIVEAPARRLHRHLRPVPAQGRYEAVDVLEAPFEVAPVALPELRLASGEIWADR